MRSDPLLVLCVMFCESLGFFYPLNCILVYHSSMYLFSYFQTVFVLHLNLSDLELICMNA